MTISVHFCGETVTSIQLVPFDTDNDLCGCDESCRLDACCKNEIKSIQIKDEQLYVQQVKISVPPSNENFWAEIPVCKLYSSEIIFQYTPSHSPPGEPSLYILNRALLI